MEPRKLTKEDIDKVRAIEGFPSGTDEDIIALSNASYYTACPNPFIEEFIKENGTPYDEATDNYHREPFSDDVEENKHDLIYNIHGYHTKVPPKAIQTYIKHYTKPGDIVFDGFCGSGMTGVAAQMCNDSFDCDNGRYAIISDISSYAAFISANYNTPNNDTVIKEIELIIEEIEAMYGDYYKTTHLVDGKAQIDFNGQPILGSINYVVWSNLYFCPHCSKEINYYNVMVESGAKSTQKMIKCPNCHAVTDRTKLDIKFAVSYDERLGETSRLQEKIPVLINYSVGTKRFTKTPDMEDMSKLSQINKLKFKDYPTNMIIHGDETERLFRVGITHVKQLYSERALFFLAEFFDRFKNDNKKVFLFTSTIPKLTILNRYMPEHGSRALVGPRAGTYYLPNLFVENNVIGQMKFQLNKLKNLQYKKGKVCVSTQSTNDLSNIPNDSIDYCFIDPPFGANIMYSELNYVAESWLRVRTNNGQEAIINKSQGKNVAEYQTLMTQCFSEIFRILKPLRWVTLEFHNSKNAIWTAIQESLGIAGFVIADVRTLNKEKKTINQYTAAGCVDQDLIISAYKPKESFRKLFIEKAGSEETAWEFVRQHLENIPIVVIKNGRIEMIAERQEHLLFDRMVAYHIMQGLPVPLDATDFYHGLDGKFLKRDGMYFLADQVNEYDTARIKMDIEPIQFSLFVTNEKTAISWLYQQLDEQQTYAELQPKFMQEVKSVDKFEEMPELAILLEENFLQDEKGRWYIPDRTKEGDVAKLREKKLWKEFEGYMSSKGKLKLFRSEAIRVGFSKLWKDKNYQAIVDLAERLPDQTIQEDSNLLMYYDISLSRV
ncbi:site-specific DNA-methyltransferase [Clostridium algidicarnis]|uniref:DNA methyltransferase n=1 Tax=Clostridium algidicarnis TaxID=37659 RepID=UPI001CF169B9|nr:DNA methyltransferase [Clostridium algidicarnis]MCB2287946.1 site-specific DNA-methyltransferase [Clostridium algidicarnis]